MYIAICKYRPGADLERFKYRIEHIEYMIAHDHLVRFGGAFMEDEGERSSGAMFVLDVPDRAAVKRFLAEEPYSRNGLFEEATISRVRQMQPATGGHSLQQELALEKERQRQPR
jgi:uncharacterized protein YciI